MHANASQTALWCFWRPLMPAGMFRDSIPVAQSPERDSHSLPAHIDGETNTFTAAFACIGL